MSHPEDNPASQDVKRYKIGYRYRRAMFFHAAVLAGMFVLLATGRPFWAALPLAVVVITPMAMIYVLAWSIILADITCGPDTLEIKRAMVLPARAVAWKDIREVDAEREWRIVLRFHDVSVSPVYLSFSRWAWGSSAKYYDLLRTIEERVALAHGKGDIEGVLSR